MEQIILAKARPQAITKSRKLTERRSEKAPSSNQSAPRSLNNASLEIPDEEDQTNLKFKDLSKFRAFLMQNLLE